MAIPIALRRLSGLLVLIGSTWLMTAATASAQSSSTIVGTVRDASGAAVPGVTVEVASPALIERHKIAVTGPDGTYQVVDLRPGIYSATFTLPGFQTVRREDIELNTTLTVTVNAALAVGGVAEQVTVTGGTPLIDARSGTSERPLTHELLETIPVGRIPNVAVMLVPGATTARPDVGGSETGQTANVSVHGTQGRDLIWNTDGLNMTANTSNGGLSGQYPNQGAYQEVVVQTRALPAEIGAGGVSVNLVSKDGSNRLRGELFSTYTGDALQSGNVSADQLARGLVAPSSTKTFYDLNGGAGGPIVKDRLWFYASARRFRIDRYEANTFNPDKTQSLDENLIWNATGKLTWQINPSNRLSGFVDYGVKLREHRRELQSTYQFISPEASYHSPLGGPVSNIKLNTTLSPSLLLETGFSWYYVPWSLDYQPELGPTALPRLDLAQSTLVGAAAPAMTLAVQERRTWSAIASYVPSWHGGSHQIKFGMQAEQSPYEQDYDTGDHGDLIARYRNGAPDSVLVFNTPVNTSLNELELAAFAQDSWTVARRLTINAGLRFERLTGGLDEQSAPAGQFVPARHFDARPDVIVWNNLVPRLSVAYDVTGSGHTVVKASASEFTQRQGASLVNQFNPLRQNSEVRTWKDANHDLVPQLDEIGASQGTLDRGATVQVAPDLIRPTQWEATASLEQQVASNLSFSVVYFHRRYQNLTAVVNTAVTPADYTPLTITNPLDGMPFTVYNQSAATIGKVSNVLLNSDLLTQEYDGVDITINRRFSKGVTLFGGVTVGSNKTATSASRNPNDLINSDGYDPLDSRVIVDLSGAYQLPWRLNLSSRFAYYTGQPLRRVYTISPTIVPGLRQTSQDVLLVPTGTYRKPDQSLLDSATRPAVPVQRRHHRAADRGLQPAERERVADRGRAGRPVARPHLTQHRRTSRPLQPAGALLAVIGGAPATLSFVENIVMTIRRVLLSLWLVASAVIPGSARAADPIPYDRLAQRIVDALQVSKGERVLLRYDPTTLGPLEPVVRAKLVEKGVSVETLNYGPAPDLQARLDRTDIYIWLPAGAGAPTAADQRETLARWLDAGKGRQIHFHWVGGTVDPDGKGGVHSAEFDRRLRRRPRHRLRQALHGAGQGDRKAAHRRGPRHHARRD